MAIHDDDMEVYEFSRELNHGHDWHGFLVAGIVSNAAPCLLNVLVVAAHCYAVSVVRPSISAAASAGSASANPAGRRPISMISTPFDGYLAASARLQTDDKKKTSISGEENSSSQPVAGKNNFLLTILSSDPATLLFDAASYMMMMPADDDDDERNPITDPGPKKQQNENMTTEEEFYEDARLIMLPYTIGMVMLPVLMIPSIMAPSDAMVPGMGGR
jgi:hypothetical protein